MTASEHAPAYPGEEPTISLEEAAARCGMEPKRLLGFAWRNRVGDPIGDGRWFYPSSLRTLIERAADRETASHE